MDSLTITKSLCTLRTFISSMIIALARHIGGMASLVILVIARARRRRSNDNSRSDELSLTPQNRNSLLNDSRAPRPVLNLPATPTSANQISYVPEIPPVENLIRTHLIWQCRG